MTLCEMGSRKEQEEREETQSRLDEAVEFLHVALQDGPRACEELEGGGSGRWDWSG